MKLACFTLLTGELDFNDTAALLKRLGYDGVEWRVAEVPADADGSSHWSRFASTIDVNKIGEQAPVAKKAADDHGLEVSCLTTYLPVTEHEKLDEVYAAAADMNCGMVRVGPGHYNRELEFDEVFNTARESLKEVEKLGKKHGVKGVMELHMGTIIPSASAGRRLCEGFDPEYVGTIFDPGNMIIEGMENWRMGLQLLGPYLAHFHVKNMAWDPGVVNAEGVLTWKGRPAELKSGLVDWPQCIQDLKSVGYDGWLSCEDFYDLPLERKLTEYAEFMRQLLAK